ncbi:hypothetical protein Emag_002903 [Eimeria magna]
MVRKGGDAAEFVYGLGISSLEPVEHEQDEDDMPLRFVSVQLELPDTSRNFDIVAFNDDPYLWLLSRSPVPDLHGFLFQSDGTYVDCVFYKNPTLAGKSVRLLQEEKQLLVDLRYVPKRCSYIVCTLAIYSGGTVAQLGNGTVKDFVTKHLAGVGAEPFGVELGTLLKAVREGTQVEMDLTDTESSLGVRQMVSKRPGMAAGLSKMCLAQWSLGHVLATGSPTALLPRLRAPRPQSQTQMCLPFICSLKRLLHRGTLMAQRKEAGSIAMKAAMRLKSEEERAETVGVHLQRPGEKEVTWGGEAQQGVDGEGEGPYEDYRWHKLSPTKGPATKDFQAAFVEGDEASAAQLHEFAGRLGERGIKAALTARRTRKAPLGFKNKEAFGPKARAGEGEFRRLKRPEGMRLYGKEVQEEGYEVEWSGPMHGRSSADDGDVNAKSLFSSYPSPEEYQESYRISRDIQRLSNATGEEKEQITAPWKDTVEKRLAALEGAVGSMRSDIRAIAAAASDMQRNNTLYVQELRNKLTELRGDVAADIESALAGPLRAVNMRLDKLEVNEAADAKELAEQQKKLWAVDRMVILAERNSHLIAQSLSEGLPVSLRPAASRTVFGSSHEVQSAESSKVFAATTDGEDQGVFASKALSELGKMQYHAEAFGKCLRQLASGTAPDGLKGLNPIERKVLSFAGTPKVFDALHELERAVDAINFHGSNAAGTKLY